MVLRSGTPSAAAGPVLDNETPTLISAVAAVPKDMAAPARAKVANCLDNFMLSPEGCSV